MIMTEEKIWLTVYLAATDEIVAIGHYRDVARIMGTTKECIESLVSNTKRGVRHKYTIVVENLEEKSYVVYGADNWRFAKKEPDWPEVEWLYYHGWWDSEIARRCGVKPGVIASWRERNRLPRNSKAAMRERLEWEAVRA